MEQKLEGKWNILLNNIFLGPSGFQVFLRVNKRAYQKDVFYCQDIKGNKIVNYFGIQFEW